VREELVELASRGDQVAFGELLAGLERDGRYWDAGWAWMLAERR
jgi:hypothetical protein